MTDCEEIPAVFDVGVSQAGEAILVSFSGELDLFAAQTMRDALFQPETGSASQMQVDLTQVTFFDSSALGVIVAACKRVRAKVGGTFFVTCPEGVARRIIEISGLIEYFQVPDAA